MNFLTPALWHREKRFGCTRTSAKMAPSEDGAVKETYADTIYVGRVALP